MPIEQDIEEYFKQHRDQVQRVIPFGLRYLIDPAYRGGNMGYNSKNQVRVSEIVQTSTIRVVVSEAGITLIGMCGKSYRTSIDEMLGLMARIKKEIKKQGKKNAKKKSANS